jgi:hypothetical protein
MTENEFYINLFDDFLSTCDNPDEKIMWKLRSIIKLMDKSKNINGDFCENGLRMIMSLFDDYEIEPWEIDFFIKEQGRIISENEQDEFVQILFDEIS